MFVFENPGPASADAVCNVLWLERVTRDVANPRELSTTIHNLLPITRQLEQMLDYVADGLIRQKRLAQSGITAPADVGLVDSRAAVDGLHRTAAGLHDIEHHLDDATTRAARLTWYQKPVDPTPTALPVSEAPTTRVTPLRPQTRAVPPGRSL
ncbi:hypothetical protein [Georgenia yuyongxinii]